MLFWERAFQAEEAEHGMFKGLKVCLRGVENVETVWQQVELEGYVGIISSPPAFCAS